MRLLLNHCDIRGGMPPLYIQSIFYEHYVGDKTMNNALIWNGLFKAIGEGASCYVAEQQTRQIRIEVEGQCYVALQERKIQESAHQVALAGIEKDRFEIACGHEETMEKLTLLNRLLDLAENNPMLQSNLHLLMASTQSNQIVER